MPRIAAASIEEHVRQQTDRILDAASKLFHDSGYRGTDMSAIAKAVGLKRNSLYRYYPNKDHILLACVQRDMAPHIERMARLAAAEPDPLDRIDLWLDMQIDIAVSPAHATMELMGEVRQADPSLRREIMALHEAPAAVLSSALAALRPGQDNGVIAALLQGMTQSGAAHAIRHGNAAAVKAELRRAVRRLMD